MRLAEVIGAVSLAADVSSGMPVEKGLRTVVIASRLARSTKCDTAAAYWVSALRSVGCTAFAVEETAFTAGDDNSMRNTMPYVDFDRPADAVRRVVKGFAPEAPALARASGIARFFLDRSAPKRFAKAHCESAVFFSQSLGMSDEVARALDTTLERWDGRGIRGMAGDELPLSARIAEVADVLELFWWTGGADLARSVLNERRGRALDPDLVEIALQDFSAIVAGLDEDSVWDEFLAAEPGPLRVAGDDVDKGCIALGRFGDLKSRYTLSHSRRVAALAEAAGNAAGLAATDCTLLHRAASVHDIGRVGIATGIWDKRGPLNALEWQRVRSHSHHTESILRGAKLDDLAEIAGATHERGRGAGYHKGVSLDGVSFLAKVVAASDVMAALGEERPHRPALDRNRAVKEFRSMVENGSIDARAAQCVLEASGVEARRKEAWPGGLSNREVEVVRLVAIGRTNKEIAELLGMSARTAQKHVMNVYQKLGLESRAGLALYALEHGLLDDSGH